MVCMCCKHIFMDVLYVVVGFLCVYMCVVFWGICDVWLVCICGVVCCMCCICVVCCVCHIVSSVDFVLRMVCVVGIFECGV